MTTGGYFSTGQAGYGYNTAKYTQTGLAGANPTAFTTGNSPITLFTVTGSVLCRVYAIVGSVAWTSTATTGTASVGVAGAVTAFLPTTTANGTNFVVNAAWVDTSPTLTAEALASAAWTPTTGNIIATIATNSMTAGNVVFYCDWIPLTAGASVVGN